MTKTMNPLATINRAQRLGLNLINVGTVAAEKACYFHTSRDNFALFNYYTALGDLCHYVVRNGLPSGLRYPDGTH